MPDKILIVRSGGGLPGLDIHTGIWMGLNQFNIQGTHFAGTSAGAIISGYHAAGWDIADVCARIMGLKESAVLDYRHWWALRFLFMDGINGFINNKAILKLLNQDLPADWSKYAPLRTWTVNSKTGDGVNSFTQEMAIDPAHAIVASMSIRGVFPAQELLDGSYYTDGGTDENLPVTAWEPLTQCDKVYLCVASGLGSPWNDTLGEIDTLLQNINMLMEQQSHHWIEEAQEELGNKCVVIWPQLKTPGTLHFDHGLIQQAMDETVKILERE